MNIDNNIRNFTQIIDNSNINKNLKFTHNENNIDIISSYNNKHKLNFYLINTLIFDI